MWLLWADEIKGNFSGTMPEMLRPRITGMDEERAGTNRIILRDTRTTQEREEVMTAEQCAECVEPTKRCRNKQFERFKASTCWNFETTTPFPVWIKFYGDKYGND